MRGDVLGRRAAALLAVFALAACDSNEEPTSSDDAVSGSPTPTATVAPMGQPEPDAGNGDGDGDGDGDNEVTFPTPGHEVVLLDGAGNPTGTRWEAASSDAAWLGEPERVVFAQERDGDVWVVAGDPQTGDVELLIEAGASPAISPDPNGRTVLVRSGARGEERRLIVLDRAAAVVADLTDAGEFALSPDGRLLAVELDAGGDESRFAIVDTTSGDVTEVEGVSGARLYLKWTPDASALLAVGDRSWILSPAGAVRHALDPPPAEPRTVMSATWAPDAGAVLLWHQREDETHRSWTALDRIDVEDGAIARLGGDLAPGWGDPAVAPDGERMAMVWVDREREQQGISVVPLDDLSPARIRAGTLLERPFDPAVTPYGAHLGAGFHSLSWSADGRALAVIERTHQEAPGGREAVTSRVLVLDTESGDAREVAASPEFYASPWPHPGPQWSAGGGALFVARWPCTECGLVPVAVEAIDVSGGVVAHSFESSAYILALDDGAAHLVATPRGLVRTTGRDGAGEPIQPQVTGNFVIAIPSPGGDRYAITVSPPSIMAADIDGGHAERLAAFGYARPHAMVAGDRFITTAEGHWTLHDFADGTSAVFTRWELPHQSDLVPSPSGRWAVAADGATFAVLDLADLGAAPLRDLPIAVPEGYAWSPDENRIALWDRSTIGIIDLESGDHAIVEFEAQDPAGHQVDKIDAVAWSRDGATLEVAAHGWLWRLDLATGVATAITDGPPGSDSAVALLSRSPDGETLVAATQRGLFALEDDGSWRDLLGAHVPRPRGALLWSPDSSMLAYPLGAGSADLRVIVVPVDGSGAHQISIPAGRDFLGWLPDGRIAWTLPV